MAKAKSIVQSYIQRKPGSVSGETLVIANHIRQMQMWMVRQGLKFYPKQDDSNRSRRKKIEDIIRYNALDLYWYGIVNIFLTSGSLLWYLRPSGTENYEIHWFAGGDPSVPETGFKAYYKPGGRELQEVVIRYSYDDYSRNGMGFSGGLNGMTTKKWIRLRITASTIVEEHYHTIPSLFPEGVATIEGGFYSAPFHRTQQVNTLGYIPCVVSSNAPLQPGDMGKGEFDDLLSQIDAEDDMRGAMLKNVFQFGNGTLVTTRPAQQVLEQMESGMDTIRPSWSSQNGYHSSYSPSTRRDNPFLRGSMDGSNSRQHVARIIGNVQEGERFGYVFPDPINGDQWRFATEYREGIHEALGGIDPLGMKSGMTFGEVKSLYGKVAATAKQKCTALWTYGLCKILEMIIKIEEQAFLITYKQYLVTADVDAQKNVKLLEKTGFIPDDFVVSHFANSGMIVPPGVIGLPPGGDREVTWKWTGPVFETATRDLLDLSIVVRNMQELGVGSLQAMEFLFPDKDPNEIENLLSGVPFRFGREVTQWLGTLLSLQQQLSTIPDPNNPAMPLAASLNLTPIIQQQILTLIKEISYGTNFDPSSTNEPTGGSSGLLNSASANSGWSTASGNGSQPTTPSTANLQQRLSVSGSSSGYAAGLYPNSSFGSSNGIEQLQYSGASPTGGPGSDPGFNQPEWATLLPTPGASITNADSGNAAATAYSGNGSPMASPGSTYGLPAIPTDLWGSSIANQLYGPPVLGDQPTGVRSRRRGSTKGSRNK